MGIEIILLLAAGVILALAMRKEPPPPPGQPSSFSHAMLLHAGGGIGYLRVYVIRPDGTEMLVFASSIESYTRTGQWIPLYGPTPEPIECISVRIEATIAAEPGNIVGLSFRDRDTIQVKLERGTSTVTVDARKV